MFANMKVGTKLIAGFLAVVLVGVIIAVIGIIDMGRISGMADEMYNRELLGLSHIKNANINLVYVGRARGNVLLSTTKKERESNLASVRTHLAAIKENLDKAQALFVSDEARRLFGEYATVAADYEREMQHVFSLAGKESLAQRSPELTQALADTRKLANTLDGLLDRLSEQKEASARAAAEESSRVYRSSRTVMLVLSVGSALLGLAIGMLITRNLTRQLGGEPEQAARIASQIAAGDLEVGIATRTGDQSSMLYAMKQMRDSLAGIVSQVRDGTATIATASAQVAAGSLDLSSRTERQASSLEETASSMEELTSTVKENAENAHEANMLAAKASSVAVKGGEVIREVVGTMDQISDSAKKIVDIIAVIDGIAFQTNILALNAAVEAARAGEQGRGFAVVASEVRTLAQRSANAAKEIKLLIGDSVDKVDAGTRQVAEAGATMDDIVDSVRRVTAIMEQIALATQEQTSGIEQINQALAEMDQVTQQNAALVEEAAAASESMREQSAVLADVVKVFRLGAARPAPLAAVRRQSAPAALRAPGRRAGGGPMTLAAAGDDSWQF